MAMALHLSATTTNGSHALVTRSSGLPLPSTSKNIGNASVVVRAFEVKGVLGCQKKQLWQMREAASGRDAGVLRRSSAETASGSVEVAVAAPVAGGVTEVDKHTFWPFVEEAGAKVVVLDMYTQWCGPCKLMLPKVIELSKSYDDVAFAKLDCNQENKALAKELGVKSVPTFKIFKNAEVVGEVRGAKYDELVKAIESARSSS